MKPILRHILLISILLAGAVSNIAAQQTDRKPLRLMTYNIHNGIGMDDLTDYSRIAAVIDSVGPDLVAIQEADSVTRRSRGADVMAEIGKATGMHHLFAPAIDYDGGKYGIGILCRRGPVRTFHLPLPGSEEQRVLIVAEFDDFVFACTHLSLTEADRLLSLPIIIKVAETARKPFFIAGDFNADPSSTLISELKRHFTILTPTDAATCPADKPQEMIDYIALFPALDRHVTVRSTEIIPQTVASDHRPVVCDLTITDN